MVKMFSADLLDDVVFEVEVVKETPRCLYAREGENGDVVRYRKSDAVTSDAPLFRRLFPTRAKALEAMIDQLKESVRYSEETIAQLRERIEDVESELALQYAAEAVSNG